MSGPHRLSAVERVAVSMTIILAIGVATLATVSYVTVVRAASADLDASLLQETEAYVAAVIPSGQDDTRSLADVSRAYLEGRVVAQGAIAPILLVSFLNGRVISNSETAMENAEENKELLDPETSSQGFDTILLGGVEYRVVTSPVLDSEGSPVAVFQAALPLDTIDAFARQLALVLVASGLFVIVTGGAVSVWVARRSLSPLHEMAASAAQIDAGDPEMRIPYDGPPDELGVLADALNEMLDGLQKAFVEQRHFIADASHELRTPIAVIRGHMDLIRHEATSTEEKAESLAVIDDEARRITRMLEDLLALARLQAGRRREFQPMDVSTSLEEVAGRLSTHWETRLEHTCSRGIWILGDPDLIEQALVNIAKNAMTAAGPDGTVETECSADNGYVVITVSDSGPGIPEDALPRIFDRFYRAGEQRSESSGGSGLGLAITKGLVELHGGTISAANRDGGGAVFTVRLPRIEAPEDTDTTVAGT